MSGTADEPVAARSARAIDRMTRGLYGSDSEARDRHRWSPSVGRSAGSRRSRSREAYPRPHARRQKFARADLHSAGRTAISRFTIGLAIWCASAPWCIPPSRDLALLSRSPARGYRNYFAVARSHRDDRDYRVIRGCISTLLSSRDSETVRRRAERERCSTLRLTVARRSDSKDRKEKGERSKSRITYSSVRVDVFVYIRKRECILEASERAS